MNTSPDSTTGKEEFLRGLARCLQGGTLVKLVLGKYRGHDSELRNIIIRPVTVRDADCLSMVYRYRTKDITKNLPVNEGMAMIDGLLGDAFRSAHLFSTGKNVQIEFSKKGKCVVHTSKPTVETLPDREQDHRKERMINPDRPFLKALGVTNERHEVLPSMSRKWKQINVFLGLFQHAFDSSPISRERCVHVVDFGCGKGYLTFSVYDHLKNVMGLPARVTGVEVRKDLVGFCGEVARREGMEGLQFQQGDIETYAPGDIQVLIALHACDTATDQAIFMGIRGGAGIIMCAPCCHKEIRPQMVIPPVLRPVLQFGIQLGQEAEMVTDTLRALWLEACGYDTQVFEFISLEHTSKNKMILAVKRKHPGDPAPVLAQIHSLQEFYGIKTQALGALLHNFPLIDVQR